MGTPFDQTSSSSNPNSKPPERSEQNQVSQPITITTPEKNTSVLSDQYSPYQQYLYPQENYSAIHYQYGAMQNLEKRQTPPFQGLYDLETKVKIIPDEKNSS